MKENPDSEFRATVVERFLNVLIIAFFVPLSLVAQVRIGWISSSPKIQQDQKQKVYLKDETTTEILINFDNPGIYISEKIIRDTTYHIINIPGHGTTTSLGKPELPVIGRLIEIPKNTDLEIIIFKSDFSVVSGYNVFPYQKPDIDPQDLDTLFVKDYQQYSVKAFYPEQLAEITKEDIGIIRGHRVAFLKVNPIQYNPVTKELRIYSNIEVQVKYNKPAQVEKIDQRLVSESFEKMLQSSVLNYKDINRYNQHYFKYVPSLSAGYLLMSTGQGQTVSRNNPQTTGVLTHYLSDNNVASGCEYLIITTKTFYNSTDTNNIVFRFRNWKRQQGLMSEVVLYEDIPDADNNGITNNEDLKDYIRKAYETWSPAPTYILIIGDVGDNSGNIIIPTNYKTRDDQHSNTLRGTDLYYTTMDGDDYFPDIYMGRLSVDTDIEATNIINKIIDYERNPPGAAFANFYQNASILALFEDIENGRRGNGREDRPWIETTETIRNFLLNQGYNIDRIYATSATNAVPAKYENGNDLPNDLLAASGFQWNGNANTIRNAINNGRFMTFYRDHGARQEWSSPNFRNIDIGTLANGVMQPVIFSVACQTGWFDNETDEDTPVTFDNPGTTNTNESFCEAFIRNNNNGTLAIIGSTRNSQTGYNDFMSLGFIKGVWPNFNPDPPYASSYPDIPDIIGNPLREMGQIMNFGKFYMANSYDSSADRLRAFELYHLFGDPNMDFLISQPQSLNVDFPAGIGGNYNQNFIIKVYDQASNPVNNSSVSLCTRGGDLIAACLTNPGGEAVFEGTFNPGTLILTVTAEGFIPDIHTMEVTSGGGQVNRLNPDNGTQGQPFNVGGKYFNGSENVGIYLANQLMRSDAASGGQLGQSGVQDLSVTVPSALPNGKYNVILRGSTSNKYAADMFHVRNADPIDLMTYSQWDPSTYYLFYGDNPTWNSPYIYLTDAGNHYVGSNNLVVGNQYNVVAFVKNKSNFDANNATVTFKWANFGSSQITWNLMGTTQISVAANHTESAKVQWVPPSTGHLCILVEIYHPEDIYLTNNSGQENCHVGPTSSPLSVNYTVRNPSNVARALHFEIRQLFPDTSQRRTILWKTKIVHPNPQVLDPGKETEVTATVDPGNAYVEPGSTAEFSITNYLDGKILGGVNITAMMRIYKYQVSIHAGYSKPISTMLKYFDPGFLLYADLAYHVSPRVSIIGLFGINTFGKNSASSDTKDKTVLNINLDAQYRRTVSGVLSTYVRVGPGYYFTPGGWSKSGFNTGAGIIYHLNNHLGLNLGVDYHLITKGLSFNNVPTPDLNKNMQFLQVALGINYSF